jgi:hypothetical protein
MNEGNPELLSQLRDIHSAAEPSWWPPAPGWWVLAALALVLLTLVVRYGLQKWRIRIRQKRLVNALDSIPGEFNPAEMPHEYLAQMNKLFRVVALRAFPGTASARLQGAEWVTFIQSLLPENPASASLAALATGPYQPSPEFDADALQQLARTWIKRYG